jgi:hypothetical protein
VAGFEHEADAERFQAELRERLVEFALTLHPDKTRLIQFGQFFGLDDVIPGNLNERVPRAQAKIPNVRNWAVRDHGNRVGIWRIMEVLTRYDIRAPS